MKITFFSLIKELLILLFINFYHNFCSFINYVFAILCRVIKKIRSRRKDTMIIPITIGPAAYVILHNLQTEVLGGTEYAKSTFKTPRKKIIKVTAYVKELIPIAIGTRTRIKLPASCPQIAIFSRCFLLFEALRNWSHCLLHKKRNPSEPSASW